MAHPTQRAGDPQQSTGLRFFGSLRTKLQLFSLLLVVVPGVLIALITLRGARHALEHAVGRQLAEVAHDALEEVADSLDDERARVRAWARQEVMRDVRIGDLDKRVTRFLRSLQENGAPYRTLLCIDRSGRVVAATDPAEIGAMLGERPWAQAALAGDDFLAGPAPTSGDGPATVEMAVPILDPASSTEVIGALLGRFEWEHAMAVTDRIRRTLVPHGLTIDILLFDRDGTVLGESWHEGAQDDEKMARRAAGVSLARGLSSATPRGYAPQRGVHALVGYQRGQQLGVDRLAVVIEPLAETVRPVRQMQRRIAFGLGAVVLSALVVATYVAGRVSHPLRDLTRATQEIAHAGAPRKPVTVRSRDEIGRLAAAFNVMTAELERAQDDLLAAAKFAFVGEVAAGVAHEARTPLGILRSSAQMIQRAVPAGADNTAELAAMMIEEVDRLDRVVDGLLELARPRRPCIEPTPLAAVLARALDFVDAQAREKGIRVRRDFVPDHTPARCDPEQMYQVALNLIVNALQMLPVGGYVMVRTLPRRNDRVGFEVSDDGPGIPSEARARVFTPFFSLRRGGTGLGLALVQRVVQAHQGRVFVESAVGKGTTFRVELPAAEDTA